MENIFNWLFRKSEGFVIPEYKNIPPPPPKEKKILTKSDFYLMEFKGYWKIETKMFGFINRRNEKIQLEYFTKEKAIEAIEYIIDEYNNYPKIHQL